MTKGWILIPKQVRNDKGMDPEMILKQVQNDKGLNAYGHAFIIIIKPVYGGTIKTCHPIWVGRFMCEV